MKHILLFSRKKAEIVTNKEWYYCKTEEKAQYTPKGISGASLLLSPFFSGRNSRT